MIDNHTHRSNNNSEGKCFSSIEKREERNEAICKKEKMPNKEFDREQVAKTKKKNM